MNDLRKAAEMALEALSKVMLTSDKGVACENAKKALRQALAQHVDAVNISQECVDKTAKCVHDALIQGRGFMLDGRRIDPADFYKQEPKREWVGLTNADKQEAFDETQEASGGFWEFADYLDAKLKEKNT